MSTHPKPTAAGDPITLSTGQTVELPLRATATMLGATFAVPRAAAGSLLPDGLRPILVRGDTAALTVLGVEYHEMGVEGIEPYDEVSVMIPATHGPETTVPYLSALWHATDGYVWDMPVTSEPAKALGVDVWGYPKSVRDITHEDIGPARRTTVSEDGERFLTLEVERPPAAPMRKEGYAYAVKDGVLSRLPNEVDADVGAWPYSDAVSLELGPHERAEPLRDVDFGDRALARVSLEGEVLFYPGEPV